MDTKELVQWIGRLIHDNTIVKFYKHSLWRHLRQDCLDEQHNECQICKSKGLVETATVGHHMKTVRKHPELALTKSNILCVCAECHYQIHHPLKKKPLNIERW
ncbi:HNH endonuclease [Clostridium estertheticum]|uniref:HNH endonuclease n=1 Tax=Clostridium estertheticum TaxID=238834 RepID=A0AA47I7Y6_9CLOT|nr:HNH endonuclease [Clostridium estertheticum]MBU3153492.1 HNH endonuclease [Clostridium estertheticum]WAG60894.1 HNH endonuclease [Clostridium estertheticum]